MSSPETTQIPYDATASGVKDPELLFLRIHQPRTDNRQAARGENHTQKRASSPTSIERAHEDTFHAVGDAVIAKEKPSAFKEISVVTPANGEILVRDVITGNTFHVGEAKKKLVLEALTAQQKEVDNRLSANLHSLIECILRKRWRGHQKLSTKVSKAVIDNPRFTAPASAPVKLK